MEDFFFFRFYDPRVLNAYLPTCTQAELELVFGEETTLWFSYSNTQKETNTFELNTATLL